MCAKTLSNVPSIGICPQSKLVTRVLSMAYLDNFSNVAFPHLLVGTPAAHSHVHLDVVPHIHGVVVIAQEVVTALIHMSGLRGNLKIRGKTVMIHIHSYLA